MTRRERLTRDELACLKLALDHETKRFAHVWSPKAIKEARTLYAKLARIIRGRKR